MKPIRRRSLAALLAAAALAATPILAAGCGSDAKDAANSATSGAGDAVDSATSAADDAVDSATSSVDPGSDASSAQVVTVAAAEGLKFSKTTLSAKAGKVTIRMTNPTTAPHNIAIDLDKESDEIGEIVEKGGTSEITVELEAGTYEYYCSVPGHREAGMVGKITVK